MFLSGVMVGVAAGLVVGLALGQILLGVGLRTIQQAIEKVTYAVRYPRPETAPVQITLPTEDAFASSEQDQEQVPSWMDEGYVMER